MSGLQVFLLGPAQLMRGDQPVELSVAKAIALLAYLAVGGMPQPRGRLADLLWPDSLPDAARKNLRNTLWTIRKTLDEDVFSQVDADRVELSDAIWVDVQAFEATAQSLSALERPPLGKVQAAVELYRAPLLDGLAFSDAPDFEIWLATERERFGRLYLRLLGALIVAHRAESNWTDVIAVARRALAYDNLQEPIHRWLMEAHARLGERAEALRQYDRLRTALARELGVEPLPETEALRQAILDGALPSSKAPVAVGSPRSRRALPGDDAARQPFVGRQVELKVLDQERQLAVTGRARVVLITGELGIGKSRLWQEWSAALPLRSTVLKTRCLDTMQSLPFAPLTGLFSQQVCIEKLFTPPSPVPPLWLAELARLLPEIRQHWPEVPAPAVLPPEEERRRLFEAFTQTLRALKGRPLILFVDDLHWADHATLDWLVYLVDRMYHEAFMFVGAYRPNEASARLVQLVTGWRREGVAQRLPLARLTIQEVTALVAALGGDVALAEQLQIKSAGNPYFLIELSQAAPDGMPPRLVELVRTRLGRLPDTACQVLQAAAVLESGFDFAALRRTSGRGEEETLDALDALLEADVLVERQGRYEFVHPLVAAVVRDDLNMARSSFLHRRAAEALEATYAGRLATIAGQLATHYALAGRPAQAAHYAEQSAERALALTAPSEAVNLYRQAFAMEPTPARRMGWGRALYVQGDLDGARETLGLALDEFAAAGDPLGVAQARLAIAESYLPAGRGDMVIEWAERVLSDLGASPGPEVLANAYYLLGAGHSQGGGSLAQAKAHLVEAANLAAENDLPEMAARSRFELGNVLAQRGELDKALEAFENTIALARSAGARFLEVLGHNNLAYHAHLSGDLPTAREHIEAGLALAEDLSLFMPRRYLYSTQGEIALAEGQLDDAEAWFMRAMAEAAKYDNRVQAANIQANLGLVARARGNLDEALVLLEDARSDAANLMALHVQTQIDLWLAELYLERGEGAAAKEALARAEARLAEEERQGLQTWAARVKAALQR